VYAEVVGRDRNLIHNWDALLTREGRCAIDAFLMPLLTCKADEKEVQRAAALTKQGDYSPFTEVYQKIASGRSFERKNERKYKIQRLSFRNP
jgi:hypothetical protein